MGRIEKSILLWAGLGGALAVGSTGAPLPAHACGGLFCQPQQPVIQTSEQIIFSVDRVRGTVDAIINIRYAGPAEEFAWILPLQSAPTAIQVGPQSGFQVVNRLTAPQFRLQFEQTGRCRGGIGFGDEADTAFRGVPTAAEPGGVQVVSRREVGPYETVVLEGDDPERIRDWLVDNGYAVTDDMMRQVVPYVQKGDALLALRLRKNNDVGDIQPIHVTMTGDEVCVPIRLTAIAAVDDMDITVTVLSDEGRAIPENYFELELNWAKLDWVGRGANYRELVAEAADEGDGNAFTTEFAGSARVFDDQVFPPRGYQRAAVEASTSFQVLVEELARQGLLNKPGIGPILRRHVASPLFEVLDTEGPAFDRCVSCYGNLDGPVDAGMVAAEIWERIVLPEARLQDLMDERAYATRLYTLISPDEMGVDPEFAFRSDLPDVSNVHVATQVTECGFAGGVTRRYVRIEETGQEIAVDDDELRDRMPASARVRQLAEGVDVTDNRPRIARLLGQEGPGCTCVRPGRAPSGLTAGVALVLGLLLARRRRR